MIGVQKTDLKFSTVCFKISENRRSQGDDFILTRTVVICCGAGVRLSYV